MKTHRFSSMTVAAICSLVMIGAQSATSQDAAKVSPGMVKVLLENDNVRVLEIHLQPGETLGGHSHPESIVYFLTDCSIKSLVVGKDPAVVEHKAGEAAWRDPLIHTEENIGKREARALVVAMKISLRKPSASIAQAPSREAPTAIQKNRDNIVNDLNNLSAQVYQYRIRPKSMGGGEGSYLGFVLPKGLYSDQNSSFEAQVVDKDKVQFTATSAFGYGAVKVSVNEMGVLANWDYSGIFREIVVAPAVGVDQNRDAMINDLNNLAALCYQYRIRPQSMGGGEGTYKGFSLPMRMRTNENGTYSSTVLDDNHVQFRAISIHGYGVIQVELDEDGRLRTWYYTDKFK